ncbi:hypothetical protein Pint_04677 [Pistacia integerrima]|uniref:Uncharacterized protein n=1 Tax=Pistacia integerrima TaxID=434235 RepID=A0ACC0Z1N4_9ROSI|nr:hypothetical protein Pint_04677 [Pistacia integerrima]
MANKDPANKGSSTLTASLPLTFNIANHFPVPMERPHYRAWRSQFLNILTIHDLSHMVDASATAPPPPLEDGIVNPAHGIILGPTPTAPSSPSSPPDTPQTSNPPPDATHPSPVLSPVSPWMEVTQHPRELYLTQRHYMVDLLQRFQMDSCASCATPIGASKSMTFDDEAPFPDATLYRSMVGGLQYLALTRLDIAFVVNQVA